MTLAGRLAISVKSLLDMEGLTSSARSCFEGLCHEVLSSSSSSVDDLARDCGEREIFRHNNPRMCRNFLCY